MINIIEKIFRDFIVYITMFIFPPNVRLCGGRGKPDDFAMANNLMFTTILARTHHSSGHPYQPVVGRFHTCLNIAFCGFEIKSFVICKRTGDFDP